jgi:hypothetical protein
VLGPVPLSRSVRFVAVIPLGQDGSTAKGGTVAVCVYCDHEMLSADGCTADPIVIEGTRYEPIRYGSEDGFKRVRRRCRDCNVLPGGVHHHGCDTERCPACEEQSISCGCLWAGEEHLAEDWVHEMEDRFQRVGPDE